MEGEGPEDMFQDISLVERERNEDRRGLQRKKNESLAISPKSYCREPRGSEIVLRRGTSGVVSLKAELLVSLSHLVWTVHMSPRIALTCRFFSISTPVGALVPFISRGALLTHPLRLCLGS